MILCGEYGVGKSSLFRRFAQDTFVASSDRASTLGLDHYDKVYKVIGREIKVSKFGFSIFGEPTTCKTTLPRCVLQRIAHRQ